MQVVLQRIHFTRVDVEELYQWQELAMVLFIQGHLYWFVGPPIFLKNDEADCFYAGAIYYVKSDVDCCSQAQPVGFPSSRGVEVAT
mmetsp:Transcript_15627/g.27656  ORF Transcript_15627/g.27656 Transcript_15627/m.27656 type:complete len:86 (-) Transcript_15627:1125-1382(-)